MNNRLTEVREENDADGVNDLTTCIFTSAATLPNLFLSPTLPLFYKFWTLTHTHIFRHYWVCAGTMLEVNSLLSALNAWAQSHCCLVPNPTTTTPKISSKRDLKRFVCKSSVNRTPLLLTLNNAVNSSQPTDTVRRNPRWEVAKEAGLEIRHLQIQF